MKIFYILLTFFLGTHINLACADSLKTNVEKAIDQIHPIATTSDERANEATNATQGKSAHHVLKPHNKVSHRSTTKKSAPHHEHTQAVKKA